MDTEDIAEGIMNIIEQQTADGSTRDFYAVLEEVKNLCAERIEVGKELGEC